MINLDIASKSHISIDPVYPGSCFRGSIVVGELRGTLVLSLP